MNSGRAALILLLAVFAGLFIYYDVGQYLTLDYLKGEQDAFTQLVQDNPTNAAIIFFTVYIAVTAASFPGAAMMTLAGGAVFGFWWALLLVSFASTIGATLALLVARFILREQVQKRFAKQLKRIDAGIEKEGAFYLFTLRLVPIIPFFVINLAMGLTKISVPLFFIISLVGMFAGTIVYVNAGTQLAQIESLSGILSPSLLFSFVLLGLFPLIAKKIVDFVRSRAVLRGWEKPSAFDRDVIVIGAGSGGLVAALIAATVKAKVTLIEKNKMGGDCLNTGCVPSKALIRSARLASDMKRGVSLGFKEMQPEFDFADVMERVQRVIRKIEPHDSVERFESLGVNVEIGEAEILSPYTVRVNGQVLSTRNIIIATGAEPFIPPIKGIERIKFLTSDNLWELRELPRRLVVLGGGPIGTELTQTFNRLGCEVTQVEREPQIMTREDPEIAEMVAATSRAEGVTVLTGYTATEVVIDNGEKFLICAGDEERKIPFDELLVAVGRKANSSGFGLENLNVEITDRGTIAVDEYLRTNYPNIYAIGDVAGPYQFTHTAAHMAWYATVNALFGTFRKFRVDYSVVPWSTFCSPEVARVGINEKEAKAQNIDYEVTQFDVAELDRAIADEVDHGVVKVLTVPGKDTILGVTIAADHAGDLISEYVLAMKHGLGLNKILGTIHIYPTLAEMNKYVAGEWRKNHKPDWALDLAEKYHRWRRGKPAVKKVGAVSKPSEA
ncbi:MAG: FAD-dependent oxidoreductase [Proteobacteria bacterium]|nr:FAD-dependent oxidoreductase [Pseudomonadota bacterium]